MSKLEGEGGVSIATYGPHLVKRDRKGTAGNFLSLWCYPIQFYFYLFSSAAGLLDIDNRKDRKVLCDLGDAVAGSVCQS